MSTLGRAVIEFSAETAKFTGDVGRAAAMFEKNMRGMTNAAQSLLQVVGVGIGVGAMVSFAKSTIDAGDELFKMSQKTGIAVEDLSTLKYAAELSDTSLDALGKGVKKLSTTLVEATDVTSKSGKLMKSLGMDVTQGTLPALEKLADIFSVLPDGPTKSALAVEVLGRAGMDMIPLLNQGAAGIRRLREEGEALGLKMSTETARAAEQFNDNMKAVQRSTTGAAQAILQEATPSLVRIGEAMKAAAVESGILGAAWVALGGIAAEALGLNDSDLKKIKSRLREVTEEASKFGAVLSEKRKAELLDNATLAANATEFAFVRARAAMNHFKNLSEAMQGGFQDQNDRRALKRPDLGGAAKSDAERKALEDKIRAALSHNEGAARKAAAETLKYEGIIQSLTKKLMGLTNEGEAAIVIYELTVGTLKDLSLERKANILAMAGEIDMQRAQVEISKQAVAAWEAENEVHEKSLATLREMEIDQSQANRAQLEQLEFERSMIGKNAREQEQMNALRAIDLDLRQRIAALPKDDSAQTSEAQIRMMEEADEQKRKVIAGIRERQEAEREWITGAKAALLDYADTATNAARNASEFFTASFRKMEDALVEFAMTGKLNFKDLADSIIRDIIRIQVREQITGPIAKAASSFLGDAVKSIFGSFGGGRAEGGPLESGKWYVAGERGPEPIWGGGAGAFAAGYPGGGASGGNTYYIDARGADAGVEQRLTRALLSLAGPGVVEQRAVGAVFDQNLRGNRA